MVHESAAGIGLMVEKIISSFLLLFGPIALGYGTGVSGLLDEEKGSIINSYAVRILSPPVILVSIWGIQFSSGKLVFLPLIGLVISLCALGMGSIVADRFRLPKASRGSFLLASGISNVGETFAALLVFVLMGQPGFGLAMLYCTFTAPWSWTFMFWVAGKYSEKTHGNVMAFLKDNPSYMFPSIAVLFGFLLKALFGYPPEFLVRTNSVLIPLTSGILLFSIGVRLRPSVIGRYKKLIPYFLSIKFLQAPVVSLILAYLLGFFAPELRDALRVILIESIAPAGMYSMSLTMVFDLDHDLAGSLWLVSTLFALILAPFVLLVANAI